ncbi:Polyamine oxidase [Sphaceloma murrayae]|uniref:Polyamine oxidase n=1 Tax=Sphaceloma murrayae TaxID=2082308 RepID=A0A2K1QNP0_9PEZI|nr:Polyamine oxidase [Sphaceloma murrayae]
MKTAQFVALLATLVASTAGNPVFDGRRVYFHKPYEVSAGSLHNIHVDYLDPTYEGHLRLVHGSCDIDGPHQSHHEIGSTFVRRDTKPDRFVWIIPQDVVHRGCLHAYSGSELVGRSHPIGVSRVIRKRQSIADVADFDGPWFEGVAYLQNKTNDPTFVSEAKSKRIAIVGGGMSGLLTSLILDSVGMTNWHIIESSQRVGGRVRTKYLANSRPEDYQYQEMGPMRFPVAIRYANTNETLEIQDHKMVFQLAETLNRLNGNNSDLAVKFIPWIQSNANTPTNSRGGRLPDGRIPSAAQVRANPSLAGPSQPPPDAAAVNAASSSFSSFIDLSRERVASIAANVYKAHKEAIARGIFSFSETAYVRYELNQNANVTDFVAGTSNGYLWGDWYDSVYFSATSWRTIDKGIEMLPRAFGPLIKDRVTFGRKVEGLTYLPESNKIAVNWRNDPFQQTPESEEYDYAVVAAPFTKVRLWRTPQYSSALSRAISTMNYSPSCKVALHYQTRFWEKLSPPIIGGCGSTDIPGLGNICYPAYAINSSGPGVILGSYASGTVARSVAALSEEDHVALVQRAMVEAHGPIAAEQFTGNYDRQCWETDEHQAGAWASPNVGQQDLYLPAYYQTEFKTIFIGEHTSYTHAWIFSALDSAVRGSAQLLLDLGLVDEAKEVVQEWMGRWIEI